MIKGSIKVIHGRGRPPMIQETFENSVEVYTADEWKAELAKRAGIEAEQDLQTAPEIDEEQADELSITNESNLEDSNEDLNSEEDSNEDSDLLEEE